MTARLKPEVSLLRRRPSREAVLTLLFFATLMATVVALGSPQRATPRYDPASGDGGGLLGLRWWLEDLGYAVDLIGREEFILPSDAHLLFVYPNQHPYTRSEAQDLHNWVSHGHTLVIIGPDGQDTALAQVFGVRTRIVPEAVGSPLVQRQPLLPDAPAGLGRLGVEPVLNLDDTERAIPVIETENGYPTAALMNHGQGVVWFLSPQHALVNSQLRDPKQAQLALAFLRTVPIGNRVVFDDYHLLGPERRIRTLSNWLYETPTGWATLFVAFTFFIYLLLQGIRLGRPLATSIELRRREAAEYVTALAGLQRRARLGPHVAQYHKRRLKLGLGRRLHLSPDLDDAAFMARLSEAGRLAPQTLRAIRDVLIGLSRQPDEANLVKLVQRVDTLLANKL